MVVLLLGLGFLLGCDNSFSLFLNFYDVSSLSCSHSRIIQYFIESFLCNLHNHIIFNSLHLFSIGQYKGRREPNASNILGHGLLIFSSPSPRATGMEGGEGI